MRDQQDIRELINQLLGHGVTYTDIYSKLEPLLKDKHKDCRKKFIAIYEEWHTKQTGYRPLMDATAGKKGNEIITYLKGVARDKARGKDIMLTAHEEEIEMLNIWQYVLSNWDNIRAHYQNATRLMDIRSNIQNILNDLRNGQRNNLNQYNGDYKQQLAERMAGNSGKSI